MTEMVYLAYAWGAWDECRELVGVFASKSGAYRAARKRVDQLFVEHWDLYRDDTRWAIDFTARWSIVSIQVKP